MKGVRPARVAPPPRLRRLTPYAWELPRDARAGMLVPGIVYADEPIAAALRGDEALGQLAGAACLPGIVRAALAMPDVHAGYGLPIGGVVATRVEDGVVTPGGVGFDINCGVRLARTRLHREDLASGDRVRAIVAALLARVPGGVGSGGGVRLAPGELDDVLVRGAAWAVARGFGSRADLEHAEDGGCLAGADPDAVGERARLRGRDQLGTLGSGNHFVEVQWVDEVYDPAGAAAFGLAPGQVTVMIHSGSRGLGHQVCTDYLGVAEAAARRHRIRAPDRQLAGAPLRSPEGERYLAAMRAAANYAWANRQCLMWSAREAVAAALGLPPERLGLGLVYDVAHNVVKIERHRVDGRDLDLAVHRKGATRAFPAGRPEVPPAYREVGQPVLIPGDMGSASYVLAGEPAAMERTFGSACHGAGRALSRAAAARAARGRSIAGELEARGVVARSVGRGTLAEEMPEAYKDVAEVVGVVEAAGLARRVARLRPLGVVKG